jgi:hypothetical protein
MKLDPTISKDRAIPSFKKYQCVSIAYGPVRELLSRAGNRLFCPAARFAVCGMQKRLA